MKRRFGWQLLALSGALALVCLERVEWRCLGTCVASGSSRDNVVALTFDDGPNPPFTDEILAALDRHQAKATFFLIGRNVESYPLTARKILSRGHQIGNHSYSHPRMRFLSVGRIRSEIRRADDVLRRIGLRGRIAFRAPYGDVSFALPIAMVLEGRRNIVFDIYSRPPDFTRPDPRIIADTIVSAADPGGIILLHDGEGTNVETVTAVEMILSRLEAKGYGFVTVDELVNRR